VPIISGADGGGGAAFNGGTITGALLIAPTDINAIPLEVDFDPATWNVSCLEIGGPGHGNWNLKVDDSGNVLANGVTMQKNGDTRVVLSQTKAFEVRDHQNNPIFRVAEDGTVHILTGQTVLADL
jgi:hypothetical protein